MLSNIKGTLFNNEVTWRSPPIKLEALRAFMSGDNSDTDPPDPISNSEVKRISGDGSVGFPHVRVAHRQASILLERETKSP